MPEFASSMNLSTLDGANGFEIRGEAEDDDSGASVSLAGDVNGDGFTDVLIGAYNADANGRRSGASYVVFGSAAGFSAELSLSALNGADGFRIKGEAEGDSSGRSVSDAGDVNGDGIDDFIIGAGGAGPNGFVSGASYLVFGRTGEFGANLELSALNGANGFEIRGKAAYDLSGYSVSSAGDVNGDGFADLIIGAGGSRGELGASYVVFGKSGGFAANLNLSTLNGSNGFEVRGEAAGDRAGSSVSAAGDVNGDGFGDLIIGARYADPNGHLSGTSYVIFGKAAGFSANLELSALNGRNGFEIRGERGGDVSGYSVSGAGDVNGDGFADLIIGARGSRDGLGASYVVFGKPRGFSANLDLTSLNGSNGFVIRGEAAYGEFGSSVSNAGDVNGDGFDDLIIGAPEADRSTGYAGASYVVFGKASFLSVLNVSALNGSNGFEIRGEAPRDVAGCAVSTAGDVNGDGFDDLIVGAYLAGTPRYSEGASYVVFGHRALSAVTRVGTSLAQTINGGLGNDRFDGGSRFDRLIGWEGNDTYVLNDINRSGARLAFDTIVEAADAGIDTARVASLDSNRRGADGYVLADNVENGLVTGFRAFFLSGNDLGNGLTGNAAANTLQGLGGNDRLTGGLGNDRLVGGLGQDIMNGGAGDDDFDFNALAEMGLNATTRDVVAGFAHLSDDIDVSTIDAIAGGPNNAFAFLGMQAFTAPGQLRLQQAGADTIVQLNTMGNGIAEATILLSRLTAALLSADDFIL